MTWRSCRPSSRSTSSRRGYRPFAQGGGQRAGFGQQPRDSEQQIGSVLSGFRELEPHADAATALRAVRDGRVRAITLTNVSAANSAALLDRAGLSSYVEHSVSVDDVRRLHGAREADLVTAWVSRLEGRAPEVFDRTDVSGRD